MCLDVYATRTGNLLSERGTGQELAHVVRELLRAIRNQEMLAGGCRQTLRPFGCGDNWNPHGHGFPGRPTSDNAQLTLRFPCGCLGNLYVSLCVGDGELRKTALIINYERGTIYRNVGPTERPGSRDLVQLQISAIREGRGRILERAEVPGGSGTYNWGLFHRAVCGEKLVNEVTPEEIVAGLRVVAAMARSEVSGMPETVERQPATA